MGALTIEETWKQVQARFEGYIQPAKLQSAQLSADELRKKIEVYANSKSSSEPREKDKAKEKYKEKERERGKKRAKAKEIGLNMITCFQLLGGIAAQGAAIVSVAVSIARNRQIANSATGFWSGHCVFQCPITPSGYPYQDS